MCVQGITMCDPGIEFHFRASVWRLRSGLRSPFFGAEDWSLAHVCLCMRHWLSLHTGPDSKLEDKTHPALACLLSLSAATMRSRCAVAVPGVPRARARMAWIFADSRAAV